MLHLWVFETVLYNLFLFFRGVDLGKFNSCVFILGDAVGSLMVFHAVCKNGIDVSISKLHSSIGSVEDFPDRTRRACEGLQQLSEQHVIFSSYLEGAFALDINIPKMPLSEIKNALAFEIQRQIPLPLDTLAWTYRIVGGEKNQILVRIFAVRDELWKKTLSAIVDSGIKIDFYMHPLLDEHYAGMIVAEDATQFFQFLMKDFAEDKISSEVLEAISDKFLEGFHFNSDFSARDAGSQLAKVLSCIIFRSKNPLKELMLFDLPLSLKPVRFKFLKISFIMLIILNILLVGILFLRYASDARRHLFELRNEKAKIEAELQKIEKEESENKNLEDFMKEISEADPGDNEVVLALLSLSKNLPSDMWITSFNLKGREIYLSVSSSNEKTAQSELAKLTQLSEFSSLSIRNTRRDKDGTIAIYLKLTHNKVK